MPFYEIDGFRPVVHPSSFVHPTATLIGDVHVGPGCYVGPGAAMRGDFGRLIMGAGANLQDNCVVHGFPMSDTVLEDESHIGHGAIIHGCVVRRNALIGMNAVINDGAEIGAFGIHADARGQPAFGAVPPKEYESFLREADAGGRVMFRVEVSAAQYARVLGVLRNWERRVRERALLYPDVALDNILLVKQASEELNRCEHMLVPYALDWGLEDDTLVIADNGRGFDLVRVASRAGKNFGLQFMRERAELIGAQLNIESRQGEGTRILLRLPKPETDSR